MNRLTQRSRDILAELSYNTQSKTARIHGVSRQWVNYLKQNYEELIDKAHEVGQQKWELEDTGCEDGTYPSCLNCPLEVCREDIKSNE